MGFSAKVSFDYRSTGARCGWKGVKMKCTNLGKLDCLCIVHSGEKYEFENTNLKAN
jgi:hypothetical protein